MNILLINHYAGSPHHGMEFRPYYLAREWVRQGHSVTIVAASHSHLRKQAPHMSSSRQSEVWDGIRYIWLATPRYRGNGVGRILNMLSFVAQLKRYSNWFVNNIFPDVVIASSTYPLDAIPAVNIARKCQAAFVFEVHDLWPLTPIELGKMSPHHPYVMILQYAEDFAYRNADLVVSMLPKAEPHMRDHGLAEGKFVYIPNGIDVSEWTGERPGLNSPHREVLELARNQGKALIGYAGSHGTANGLDVLLRAAANLQGVPVTFALIGDGPEKNRLVNLAREMKLSNVEFLPPVPKEAVPQLLAQMDGLLISWLRSPLYRFGTSPNKLMDYMMAGKPIVQAIETSHDIVSDASCGFTIAPEDPLAMAEAIRKLILLSETDRAEMGSSGTHYVLANHDYRVLAQKFIGHMESCRQKRAQRIGAANA